MRVHCSVLIPVIWLTGCDAAHVPSPEDSGVVFMDSGTGVDGSTPSVDASTTTEDPASTKAQQDAATAAAPAPIPLCDGSSDIRLVWQLDDQIMGATYPFTVPYGSSIIVVDGHCHFHASRDHRVGYSTGTLSAEQASELSRDMAFAELRRVGSQYYYPKAGCVDIPAQVASTSAGAVRCACGCPAETPQAIADALQSNAKLWLKRLEELGQPYIPSVVSALAVPLLAGSGTPAGEPQPWPLEQNMDSVPNLKLTGLDDPRWNKGPYARIEGAREVAALHALRKSDLTMNMYPTSGALVTDGAQNYRLFVRDELPEDFAAALRAFLVLARGK